MARTHLFAIPTATVLATQFPDRDVPFSFTTSIRITALNPVGLIFELGDATTAIAAWVDNNLLSFRAGEAAADDRGIAVFNNTVDLDDTREFRLTFAVSPGDGRVRIYGSGGLELARGVAVNGQLTNGWAAASNGAFAAAATGALPADVTETGTPTNFEVIEPLRAFVGQVPRHFI